MSNPHDAFQVHVCCLATERDPLVLRLSWHARTPQIPAFGFDDVFCKSHQRRRVPPTDMPIAIEKGVCFALLTSNSRSCLLMCQVLPLKSSTHEKLLLCVHMRHENFLIGYGDFVSVTVSFSTTFEKDARSLVHDLWIEHTMLCYYMRFLISRWHGIRSSPISQRSGVHLQYIMLDDS